MHLIKFHHDHDRIGDTPIWSQFTKPMGWKDQSHLDYDSIACPQLLDGGWSLLQLYEKQYQLEPCNRHGPVDSDWYDMLCVLCVLLYRQLLLILMWCVVDDMLWCAMLLHHDIYDYYRCIPVILLTTTVSVTVSVTVIVRLLKLRGFCMTFWSITMHCLRR